MSEDEDEELELLESELELEALSRDTATCCADSGFSLAVRLRRTRSAPPGSEGSQNVAPPIP